MNIFRHNDSPGRVYLTLAITLGVMIATMIYVLYSGNRIIRTHGPLIDAAMEIKLELTTAHLWFEEVLSGDRHESIEQVWDHLDEAQWYAKAMIDGGQNEEGTFVPLDDPALREAIRDVQHKLELFRTVTLQRWNERETSAIGSDIDQRYDDMFEQLVRLTDAVENRTQQAVARETRTFQALQIGLIVGCVFLAVFVVSVIHRYMQRRLQAERALTQEKRRLESVASTARCGLVLLDSQARVTYANELAQRWFATAGDIRGKAWQEVLCLGETDEPCAALEAQRTGMTASAEKSITLADGQQRVFYVDVSPMVDQRGDVQQMTAVILDITDRKLAEQEREELLEELESKNIELERFAYSVSHDLKSPLVTIKGYLGLLQQDLAEEKPKRIEDDMNRIASAADKMATLLNDVFELSRIGRVINPPEDVPLGELVREVGELLHAKISDRQVRLNISPNLPILHCDRTRLGEVVQNLIENGIHYMGDQSDPHIEIDAEIEDNMAVCRVRDNGIGIEPQYHEQIFGLFDTLDRDGDGSGVGLALVKRIVEVHGGRVWVESKGWNQGATFYFSVPIGTSSQADTEFDNERPATDGSSCRG